MIIYCQIRPVELIDLFSKTAMLYSNTVKHWELSSCTSHHLLLQRSLSLDLPG